ncbi:hypothetical protein ABFS82_01G056300 [Erythranthe guttata]
MIKITIQNKTLIRCDFLHPTKSQHNVHETFSLCILKSTRHVLSSPISTNKCIILHEIKIQITSKFQLNYTIKRHFHHFWRNHALAIDKSLRRRKIQLLQN